MTKPTKEEAIDWLKLTLNTYRDLRNLKLGHSFEFNKATEAKFQAAISMLDGQEVEIDACSAAGARCEMACEWFICPACTAEVDEETNYCTGCGAHITWVRDK